MISFWQVIKLLLVVVALVGGWIFGNLKNNQLSNVKVQVNVPSATKISVYKDLGGDGPYSFDPSQPLASDLSYSQEVNLSPGTYDLVASDPNHVYVNDISQALVNATTSAISPHLSYTESKLQAMLPGVRAAAQAVLFKTYPTLETNYTVSKDGLFMLGDWYGAVLKPVSPNMDTLRVILESRNGSWTVAVRQPDISIGEPSNPKIPAAVVEAADQL